MLRNLVLSVGVWLFASVAGAQSQEFSNWLELRVWPAARSAGVSRPTFDAALGKVQPDRDLPGLAGQGKGARDHGQAEFGSPARYFAANILQPTTDRGRDVSREWAKTLAKAERQTGVPARIILAIWGRESAFGRAEVPHDVFRTLATRGFFGPRAEYFTAELIAALRIAEGGHAPIAKMKSSVAGALGQPQFMPSAFLRYASDGNGDRRADIWSSEADTIFSIGRYLQRHGWVAGRDWGFEVELPRSVSCALEGPDMGRTIAEWEALGIRRVSGKVFPVHERAGQAFLMLPAGRYGPAFLVTPNFYVLKDYNQSDLYALFVGHLGDRIAYGMPDFVGAWRAPSGIKQDQILDIQKRLQAKGYDVGGADGLVGFKTRRAIGAWQTTQAHFATCYPDAELFRQLRR